MSPWILAALALLPAAVLCVYLYIKDRVEKEPVWLLLKLLVFGALLCFPVGIAETFIEDCILGNIFSEDVRRSVSLGAMYHTYETRLYIIMLHFCCVALCEEGGKFIVLNLFTKKNKAYNCSFDGLIYAVFVSLGFAALENVFYVLKNGLAVAIARAILSVPGHMFFAVMMGFYYSMWHILERTRICESCLAEREVITIKKAPISSKKARILSLLLPVLCHGFYNTSISLKTTASIILMLVFVVFLYIHCFRTIKDMSKYDKYEDKYIRYALEKKYPELKDIEYSDVIEESKEINAIEEILAKAADTGGAEGAGEDPVPEGTESF